MAFRKNALATLGIVTTLLGSPNAVSSEPIEKTKLEQKVEQDLKSDLKKPQTLTSRGMPNWTILDTGIDSNFGIYFKLPNKFSFDSKGNLSGKGFHWDINDDDFSYNNIPLINYFKSLENINDTYMRDIRIGNMSLDDFINLFNTEKDAIADALLENAYGFKEELLDIFEDQYSEDFIYSLIGSLVSGNLDSYLDKNGVTEEQKEKTKDALEDFLKDMDYVFDDTKIDDVIKGLLDSDPFDSIYLKNRSLRDILNIAEGFGDLMNVKITDDSIIAKMNLEGKGQAKGDLSFSYKVMLGDKIKKFNHVLSSEYSCFGKAQFGMRLNFEEGAKISEFFGIKPILVFIYGLEDIDIPLKDIILESNLKIKSELFQRISEGFELSEDSKFGKKGFGMVYEKREISQENGDISLGVKLDSREITMDWSYREIWKSMIEKRDRNLIYVFSEENRDTFWYLISSGLELSNEKYKWQTRKVIDGTVKYEGEEKEKNFDMEGKLNFVVGLKNNFFNPFISVKSFPDASFKLGTFLNSKYVSAKFSLEQTIKETHNNRLLMRPFHPSTIFTADALSVLFDKYGNKKIENYFIESEQRNASPLPGQDTAQDKIKRKLFSEVDGVLLNLKYSGSELSVGSIYCADSSFFVGGGYFSNVLENLHGVDFTIGYEDFLLKARYGYANYNNHYSHLANLSLGGTIQDLFIINLDLRAILLKDTEARYQGVEYKDNDVQATLNFISYF